MPTPPPAVTEFGKDWRLQFGDGQATEAFVTLAGEKGFSWKIGSNDVDTSDKDGPAGVLIPGRITFSVKGNVKLPDAGMTRVYAAVKSGAIVNMKALKGTVVKYSGPVTIGNFSADFDSDGPAPYSFDMANAATPSVNDLGATA
jgi:predicted secreted protein